MYRATVPFDDMLISRSCDYKMLAWHMSLRVTAHFAEISIPEVVRDEKEESALQTRGELSCAPSPHRKHFSRDSGSPIPDAVYLLRSSSIKKMGLRHHEGSHQRSEGLWKRDSSGAHVWYIDIFGSNRLEVSAWTTLAKVVLTKENGKV